MPRKWAWVIRAVSVCWKVKMMIYGGEVNMVSYSSAVFVTS